jgi:hypothetical protein
LNLETVQQGPGRNYWDLPLLFDAAMGTYRQRLAMAYQRLDVCVNGLGCMTQSFFLAPSIHVKPFEGWAKGMERISVLFDNNSELEPKSLLPSHARTLSGWLYTHMHRMLSAGRWLLANYGGNSDTGVYTTLVTTGTNITD